MDAHLDSRLSVQSRATCLSIRNRCLAIEILACMYLASKIFAPETAGRSATELALDEFEGVYAFIYSRVANQADAEDLTQQVALKALPRLRDGASAPEIRGYLYATARSVLATFWSGRSRLPESELPENVWFQAAGDEVLPSAKSATSVTRILERLSPTQRRVLELRFLRGYSLREVAAEMDKSVGSIKVMQLRALRAAAAIGNRQEMYADAPKARTGELLTMQARRAT
jgi:RNA polymerase sigma factor (sigma-70 family)